MEVFKYTVLDGDSLVTRGVFVAQNNLKARQKIAKRIGDYKFKHYMVCNINGIEIVNQSKKNSLLSGLVNANS